jgi:hypothetical protein
LCGNSLTVKKVKVQSFFSFRELPEGVMNYATPLLDLSNLFGLEEGKINLNINFEGKCSKQG